MKAAQAEIFRLLLIAMLILMAVAGSSQTKDYPKPQKYLTTGQSAPDFTLKDQDGKPFRLNDQHGRWVLLVFYRGYW